MRLPSILRHVDPFRPLSWALGKPSYKSLPLIIAATGFNHKKHAYMVERACDKSDVTHVYVPSLHLNERANGIAVVLNYLSKSDAKHVLLTGLSDQLVVDLDTACASRKQVVSSVMCMSTNIPDCVLKHYAKDGRLRTVVSCATESPTETSIRAVLSDAVGATVVSVQLADDEKSSMEMTEQCPVACEVHELRNMQETLVTLRAIGENLLYRSADEKYRKIFHKTDKYRMVIGRFEAANSIVSHYGFHEKKDSSGTAYLVHDTDINREEIQQVLSLLNRFIISSITDCNSPSSSQIRSPVSESNLLSPR